MAHENTSQTFKLELLSPVHIGDGEQLQKDLDFIVRNHMVEVVDADGTFACIKDNPEALKEISGSLFDWKTFTRDYGVKLQYKYYSPLKAGNKEPKFLKKFIKNAYDKVYIPGSSLKGAVRTPLLLKLFNENAQDIDIRFNNKNNPDLLLDDLAGSNPYNDFLRPMGISDTNSISPRENMAVREVKIFNVQHESSAGWKDFISKGTKEQYDQSLGTFIETLEPDQHLYFKISLDNFLISSEGKYKAGLPSCQGLGSFKDLCRIINAHSRKMADSELNFFSQYGFPGKKAVEFYQWLLKTIDDVNPEQGFVLRLSWGSGWKGMTGDWMDNHTQKEVRKMFNLGKQRMPFPKTRRLALDQEGFPSIPMGWVVVTRSELEFLDIENGGEKSQDQEKIQKESNVQSQVSKKSIRTDEEQKKEELDKWQTKLNQVQNIASLIDALLEQINSASDYELKKEMCRYLVNKAQNQQKKQKLTKALENNKVWALKIQELADSLGISIYSQ